MGSFWRFLDECEGDHIFNFNPLLLVLLSCAEGKTGCKLENVLVFFTGADCIPPLGFNREPNVEAIIMSLCDNDGFGGV